MFGRFWRNVPNAPCGVERSLTKSFRPNKSRFLMHRVELKECDKYIITLCLHLFLMHRVELKDG